MPTGAVPQLTLMVVHAHPVDESTSTGGILALYASRGVRTVVVTCTGGELGDGPGGVKPGEDGHDLHEVAAIREGELRRACAHLGVWHLELLGYRDSGMAGWDSRYREGAFCGVPVESAVNRIVQLMDVIGRRWSSPMIRTAPISILTTFMQHVSRHVPWMPETLWQSCTIRLMAVAIGGG